MNNSLKLGDKVKLADGRIGVVIRVEKDVVSQGSVGSQQLTVRFSDGATQVLTSTQLLVTQLVE